MKAHCRLRTAAQAREVKLRDGPACCRHSSEQWTKDKEFEESFIKESFAWMRTAPERVNDMMTTRYTGVFFSQIS